MDWLKDTDNVLTIFEEIGGDPSQVVIGTRSRTKDIDIKTIH
jgi:hypothetical protein